jgi:3-oxoacyl-[acyl-carrier protein] reductase
LGIRGRKAIVCASSRGLGKACALALAEAGVSVVINARNHQLLEQTAEEIRRATNVSVETVTADISTEDGQAALLAACPAPDILINNSGGGPFTEPRLLDRTAMLKSAEIRIVTPIELVQQVIDGMTARGFGRIISITSVNLTMPLAKLDLSSAGRAGLTVFIADVVRTVADKNVTINDLVPGYIDTRRLRDSFRAASEYSGSPEAEITRQLLAEIPAKRFGNPAEFGQVCAFLCSVHAGYITGHSVLVDGGAYPPSI